jgi:hypothetical protein
MTTVSASFPMPIGLLVALRHSWVAAVAEAVVCALGALLLGPALIDPTSEVSLSHP